MRQGYIKTILLLTVLIIHTEVKSQTKAVTEAGDQVLLYNDGTWKYQDAIKNNDSIVSNLTKFKKTATANFLLKSKNVDVGFYIDAKKWNFQKSTDDVSEYSFSLKENNSIIGMVVTEAANMSLASLRRIAIGNAAKISTKYTITNEEYRNINGLKVLHVESDAIIEGMDITYFNYYFTDSTSTVQWVAFASKRLFPKYRKDIEELLNGLVTTYKGKLLKNDSTGIGSNALKEEKNDVIQSALAPNSNCKAMLTGTWSYIANGEKYINEMQKDKNIEYSNNYKYKSIYTMQWIDNCHYVLKLQTTNNPAAKLIKIGKNINIEILEIDKEKMRYHLSFGELQTYGEMKKEK